MGFMLKTYKDFSPSIEKCLVKSNVKQSRNVLGLKDFSSVFLLLGIGLGTSISAFIMEHIVSMYHKRYTINHVE